MRKCTVLVLVTCLVVSSLLVILPIGLAQTKPAIPTTFTVGFSDKIGYYVNIKNQPFTPYVVNGSTVYLYYQAQVKDHAADSSLWVSVNPTPPQFVMQSDSQYTILPIPGVNDGQKLDIQVRALVGSVIHHPDAIIFAEYEFRGVEGDWSNIQTLTFSRPSSALTDSLPVTSPPVNTSPANPNPPTLNQPTADNPSLFGLSSWIGVAVVMLLSMVVVLLAIIAVSLWRKNVSQFNSTLNHGVADELM